MYSQNKHDKVTGIRNKLMIGAVVWSKEYNLNRWEKREQTRLTCNKQKQTKK